jgi:hypothetical protein
MRLGGKETSEEKGEEEVSGCAKAIGGSSPEEPPGYANWDMSSVPLNGPRETPIYFPARTSAGSTSSTAAFTARDTVQQSGWEVIYPTNLAWSRCPALYAVIRPRSGQPKRVRSPRRSSVLWRTNSSGQRSPSG